MVLLSDGWKQGGAAEEREETAVGAAMRPLVGALPQQPTPHGDGLIISNHQRQLEKIDNSNYSVDRECQSTQFISLCLTIGF